MNFVPQSKEKEDACLRDINYTREQLSDDIQTLRRWLNGEPHLPPSRLTESDHFLKNYLIGCKGSLETSKRKIDKYYSFRTTESPLFAYYDPLCDAMTKMKNQVLTGCLSKPFEDGTLVLFSQTTEEYNNNFWEHLSLFFMFYEILLRREDIFPFQLIIVVDLSKGKFDVTKMSSNYLKDSALLPEIFPVRIKQILYLNVNPYFAHFINYLLKPLLSKKIGERMQIFSGGWESIVDIIPKDILPKDAGGEGPTLRELNGNLHAALEKKRDSFLNEWRETTDESKRPPDSYKLEHPHFGAEGSFKSLRID